MILPGSSGVPKSYGPQDDQAYADNHRDKGHSQAYDKSELCVVELHHPARLGPGQKRSIQIC